MTQLNCLFKDNENYNLSQYLKLSKKIHYLII